MAELGLTPSTAVRALWEQAAARGEGIAAIAPILTGKNTKTRLLVCCDVWPALLEKRPARQEIRTLLDLADAGEVELLYPATALRGVFQLLGGDEGRKGAWKSIDKMRALGTAVGVDEADLSLACRYRSLVGSLEAGTALSAAQRADADYLVTYDEELLRRSTVAALSPKDMCVVLEARS